MKRLALTLILILSTISVWSGNIDDLFDSVHKRDKKGFLNLLQKAEDVNIRNSHGQWLLHSAISSGDPEICKAILDKGANVNAQNARGLTALHWISLNNDTEDASKVQIVVDLIEKGADVNLRDYSSQTPLHWATTHNQTEIVKALIDKGADIHARESFEGNTALHIAADKGYISIMKLLMKHGASVSLKNKWGKSPFDLIRKAHKAKVFPKKKQLSQNDKGEKPKAESTDNQAPQKIDNPVDNKEKAKQ